MSKSDSSEKPKGKAAIKLWDILRDQFPDVQCERLFPWLFVPQTHERSEYETRIFSALIAHCKCKKAQQPPKKKACDCDSIYAREIKGISRRLEFDFFIPSLSVAIEFDERQHFTKERAITLDHYDGAPNIAFDIDGWREKCLAIAANDADPPCRDWQRAFRDALRDLRAAANGVRLIRVAFDEDISEETIARRLGIR